MVKLLPLPLPPYPYPCPYLVRSSLYRPLYQKFFWFLVADFFLLSYLGQAPAESPYIEVGQVATIYYFSFFMVFVPVLGRLEKSLISVRKV